MKTVNCPSFSQKVKSELSKIRESGKEYKNALTHGISYGEEDVGGAESLIPDGILADDELGGIFLRGVFQVCGSISDPNKEYHLELVPPNNEKCGELLEFINARGLNIKSSRRKNAGSSQTFLYCKECEQIADFLTCIGATKHSMELMNVIIYKGIRNNVNRAVNCVSANIDKTARASGKQIQDIEYIFQIEAESGKTILPQHLREVAQARLRNVEMSLSEIAESLCARGASGTSSAFISKSGVNHRLKRISGIASKLREEHPQVPEVSK